MDKYEGIVKLIEGIKKLAEGRIPFINEEINSIIENKINDQKRIEKYLDCLLDFMRLDIGEREFLRLNNYYATVSSENSAFYNKFYEELMKE